jgi:hypothetical protein
LPTNVARLVAGEALNRADVGVAGIDAPQLVECFIGGGGVAAEAVIAGHTFESQGIVGIREQDLLPNLYGDVGATARLEGLGFVDEDPFGFALLGSRGLGVD